MMTVENGKKASMCRHTSSVYFVEIVV
jgi:hypothetical protein